MLVSKVCVSGVGGGGGSVLKLVKCIIQTILQYILENSIFWMVGWYDFPRHLSLSTLFQDLCQCLRGGWLIACICN